MTSLTPQLRKIAIKKRASLPSSIQEINNKQPIIQTICHLMMMIFFNQIFCTIYTRISHTNTSTTSNVSKCKDLPTKLSRYTKSPTITYTKPN